MLRTVAISDTHNQHMRVTIPECDLLIHTGDMTMTGAPDALGNFAEWLEVQPAKDIVIIPGNHEQYWEKYWHECCKLIKDRCPRVHILNDSGVEINGKMIWGSPITPWWWDYAWNRSRTPDMVGVHGKFIKEHWDLIPDNTNILLTHGPPYGILDYVEDFRTGQIRYVGCEHLLAAVNRIKPAYHFFGHIHGSYGHVVQGGTDFYNSCISREYHGAINPHHYLVIE